MWLATNFFSNDQVCVFYGLLYRNPHNGGKKKGNMALAQLSFPILFKYFAMSGEVGVEDKVFQVHNRSLSPASVV